MRRSEQRRAAVIALYQHDLTGRPLAETLGPNASLFARALAHAAADRAEELDEVIDRHAHGWSVQRIQPLERSIMRVALIEMLHPDAAPGGRADPGGGGDRGGGGEREDVLRRGRAGVRQRGAGAVLREVRENAQTDEPDEHTDEQRRALDDLIARLERAAEQLRSGELSPDAAATLVEDCARSRPRPRRSSSSSRAPRSPHRAPGQDTLL